MTDHGDWMSIGRFATRCRLSVKALRHYEKLGLLEPGRVDGATGYRSYHRGQVRRALAIAMLRNLDVPLPVVREVLDGGAQIAADALEAEAARQRKEMARRRMVLASLERLVRDRTVSPYEVTIVDVPAVPVCWLACRCALEEQEHQTTVAIRSLMEALGDGAGGWRGPVICAFEDDDTDSDLSMRIGVGCAPDAAPSLAGASVGERAAAQVARVRHVGPYASLGLAHHALHAWASEQGVAPAGPLYEEYVNDPAEVAPEALITDLSLPLGEPPESRAPR